MYEAKARGLNIPSYVDTQEAYTAWVNGASGYNQYVITDVTQIDVYNITIMFARGDLTVGELEKWLNANAQSHNITRTTNLIQCEFKYNNRNYKIACETKAAS